MSGENSRAERNALIELSLAEGVGPVTLARISRAGTSFVHEHALRIPADKRRELERRRMKLESTAEECGARVVALVDAEFPERLHHLAVPPPFIVLKGDHSVLQRRCVAIVGSRSMTRYGERICRELSVGLAAAGACIVSGLARGIDATAHHGALDVDGLTCGVMGSGIDVVYPAGHSDLQRTIGERGLLVSEFEPGSRPDKGSFPRRNRIIAALAHVIIVVEASRVSGALLTANHGLELGRDVAVVPGPIDSLTSAGTNRLLQEGAVPLTSVQDALRIAGFETPEDLRDPPPLTPLESGIIAALTQRPMVLTELVDVAGAPLTASMEAITSLEMKGLLRTELTGEMRSLLPRGAVVNRAP